MLRSPMVVPASTGLSAALALLALACAAPTSPSLIVDAIQIESVDVRILESSPPQAVAHVLGFLGDGCSEFYSLDQARSGSTITVTILGKRPRQAVCTQIAKLYESDVPLAGQYPPGRYLLRVNGFEKVFTTE